MKKRKKVLYKITKKEYISSIFFSGYRMKKEFRKILRKKSSDVETMVSESWWFCHLFYYMERRRFEMKSSFGGTTWQ